MTENLLRKSLIATFPGKSVTKSPKLRDHKPFQKRLIEKLQQRRDRRDHNPFEKRLDRKPRVMFRFEDLILKPYRRDHNPFEKRLDRKPLLNLKSHDGVINRRNGCGSMIAFKQEN
ncbi:MAG TPA: hypothetical protein VN414_05715 [Methanosarcina sp.]|nr:hypothetical protein [Methanosarcina sp.]